MCVYVYNYIHIYKYIYRVYIYIYIYIIIIQITKSTGLNETGLPVDKVVDVYLCRFCVSADWRGPDAFVHECDRLVGRRTLGVLFHFYFQFSVFTRHDGQQRPRTYKQKCRECSNKT